MNCSIILMHERAGAVEVRTKDVSASGIFIRALPEYLNFLKCCNVGDQVQARLDSFDPDAKPIRLLITRFNQDGVGLTYI